MDGLWVSLLAVLFGVQSFIFTEPAHTVLTGAGYKESMMADSNQSDGTQHDDPLQVPELVASSSRAFFMGAEPARLTLQIHEPTGPARHKRPQDHAVFLVIENVTCNKNSPAFSAFLNVPPGENPQSRDDLYAGSMGMFGLPQASAEQGEHGGIGKNFTFDITRLYQGLVERKLWDPGHLTIVFMAESWDAPVPQVKVGRVSLYLQ